MMAPCNPYHKCFIAPQRLSQFLSSSTLCMQHVRLAFLEREARSRGLWVSILSLKSRILVCDTK